MMQLGLKTESWSAIQIASRYLTPALYHLHLTGEVPAKGGGGGGGHHHKSVASESAFLSLCTQVTLSSWCQGAHSFERDDSFLNTDVKGIPFNQGMECSKVNSTHQKTIKQKRFVASSIWAVASSSLTQSEQLFQAATAETDGCVT